MKKRIVSMLIAVTMLMALLPAFSGYAYDTPVISVSQCSAVAGGIATVEVSVSGLTEGIMYLDMNLWFDRDNLELVENSVTPGNVNHFSDYSPFTVNEVSASASGSGAIVPPESTGDGEEDETPPPAEEVINYSAVHISGFGSPESGAVITGDGVIYSVKFKVKDTAEGTLSLKVDSSSALMYSASSNQLSGVYNPGSISVFIPAESITFESGEAVATLGSAYSIMFMVLPDNNTDTVTWNSSDTRIAEVSGGTVTAKELGSTVITAVTGSGKSASCTLTVIPKSDSMLPEKTVYLKSEGTTVTTKVRVLVPGPYPKKWTAYSNDHYIFVTEGKRYEVAHMADNASDVQEFTVMCVPDQLQAGIYSGSITIVCGELSEKLYVSFELTKDVNYVNYWDDVVFPENKYRENIAVGSVATASTTLKHGEVCYVESAIDGCASYWPRWTSDAIGVWEDPEIGRERTIHWYMVDFTQQKTFDKIIMFFSDSEWSFLKEFKLLASNDPNLPDEQWHEISHIEENHQRYVSVDFDPVTFRYVKCVCIDSAQSHVYGNAARIAEIKILTTKEYPEVDVETGPVLVNLKVDSTTGIDVIAQVPVDAFESIDTGMVIKAYDMFSDEYAEVETSLAKRLGYSPIFTMNNIYAYDASKQEKPSLINGRAVQYKISVPGGFDYDIIKVVKVLDDGSFENVPITLETIAEDEFMETTYMVFESDFFGKYVFIEDKYNYFGGGNTGTGDFDFSTLAHIVLLAGVILSFAALKRGCSKQRKER